MAIKLYKDINDNFRVGLAGSTKDGIFPAGVCTLIPNADASRVTILGFYGALGDIDGDYPISDITDALGVPYADYDALIAAVGSFFRKPSSGGGGNHNTLINRDIAGNHAKIVPIIDSATAFIITKADGTTPILTFDTLNEKIIANAGYVPTVGEHLTTKKYVDEMVSAIFWDNVAVATTTDIDIATELENGDLIDNYTLQTNDRVLVVNQTLPEQNGLYVVQLAGAAVRAIDANTAAEVNNRKAIVLNGDTFGNKFFFTTSTVVTLGVDPISFAMLSSITIHNDLTSRDSAGNHTVFTPLVDSINSFRVTNAALEDRIVLNTISNTLRINAKNEIVAPAELAIAEKILKLSVSDDANSYIQIENATNVGGRCAPSIYAQSGNAADAPFFVIANVPTDTGTKEAILFKAQFNATVIVNRAIFAIDNYTTRLVQLLANGNLGLGTIIPSYNISFSGNATKTIGMERHTTANNAGNSLTIQAGSATTGATDKSGGDLILKAGVGTGTGDGNIRLYRNDRAQTTGTTDNTQNAAYIICPPKWINDNVITDLFSVQVGTLDTYSCVVQYSIIANDGVDVNVHGGTVAIAVAIKGGVIAVSNAVESGEVNANSAGGAIGDTFSTNLVGTTLTIRLNANNALNTNNQTVTMNIQNLSMKEITLI